MTEPSALGTFKILDGLRRRWPSAALLVTAVLAVLVPVALGLPNIYAAKTTLLVDQLSDAFGQGGGVYQLDGRLQAIKQEALSRQRLTELVEKFDLYPALRERGAMNDVLEQVAKDVKVEITNTTRADGRAVAFFVSYVGNDPVTVARVANRLALFYVEKNDAMRTKQFSRAAEILKAELDTTRKRLEGQEQKLIEFTSKNVGALPQQVTNTLAKYGQLTTQLQTNTGLQTSLITQRDGLQSTIASLLTPRVTADATEPSVKLARAQGELADLYTRGFMDGAPQVKAKKTEISQLEGLVSAGKNDGEDGTGGTSQVAILQGQVSSINARLDAIKKNIDEINNELRSYDEVLAQAPVQSVELEKITRDVKVTREAQDALQKRYQEAMFAERAEQGTGSEEFKILDPALPPTGAASPDRRILIAGSFFLALGLGVALVFLLERLDSSFKSVDELRAFTHVPVLATIPRITTRSDRTKRWLLVITGTAGGSVALWFLSVQVFHMSQRLEWLTRLLMRFS